MTRLPVRFATPELEEQDRAEKAKRREERRRHLLARAIASHRFEHCSHGAGGDDCTACSADFVIDRSAAELARIDTWLVDVYDERPFIPQIGGCWRVLVGPAFAERVAEIVALPEDELARYSLPEMVPELPWLEVMCNGGEGRSDDNERVLLTPVNVAAARSYRTPRMSIPLDYLLTHGERTT